MAKQLFSFFCESAVYWVSLKNVLLKSFCEVDGEANKIQRIFYFQKMWILFAEDL
jgi:hypothetical protein